MILKQIKILYGFLFLVVLLSGNSLLSYGQGCDENVLNEAQKSYDLGLFEDVKEMLHPCIEGGFNDKQKIQAYRLISVSYLAIDSIDQAKTYASLLLRLKPDFDAELFGPPKFEQMLNQLKQSGASIQIVSVSKRAENLYEAPATVLVISSEDIFNRGYIDLEQLFSDLPGFDVSRSFGSTYSNIYQRGYRSNSTDRTLFLVDGVEENDIWSNISYWSKQFPISNVERIEVLYGPASTMYGANALVGVINIITKTPQLLAGENNLGVKVNTGAGSNLTKYMDLTVAGRKNLLSFSATARRFSSDEIDLSGYKEYDYNPLDYNEVDYISTLKIENADQDLANRARDYDMQLVQKNNLQYTNRSEHWYFNGKVMLPNLQLGYEIWKSENGGINWNGDNSKAGIEKGNVWMPKQSFFYAKYNYNISEKINLMNFAQYRITEVSDGTILSYMRNYSNGSLKLVDLLANKEPFIEHQNFYQISRQFRNELKITYNPSALINVVSGIEVRNSSIQGDYRKLHFIGDQIIYPAESVNANPHESSVIEIGSSNGDGIPGANDFTTYDFGAYLQGTWRIRDIFLLTLGGRYDYNKIRVTGGYGSVFNPRVAVVVTPGKFVFKSIYASAFQNASNWTKYGTTTSRRANNPTLKPEKVSNIDLSVAYRFSKDIYADIVYYNSSFKNTAEIGKTIYEGSPTTQQKAIGKLKIYGIQSNFTAKLNAYSIYTNFTYTNPKKAIVDDGEITNEYIRLGDIASVRLNSGINTTYFNKLGVNLGMNLIGNRPVGPGTSVADNLEEFPTVALFNSTFTYLNPFPGLSLQFSIKNLLNTEYADPGVRQAGLSYTSYTPQVKRNFLIRIIYDL